MTEIGPTGKHCGGCDQIKPRTAFYGNVRRPDRLATQCKVCVTAATSAWNKKYPHKALIKNKKRRHERRASNDARFAVMRKLDSTRQLAKKYGGEPCRSTIDELAPLYTTICAICGIDAGLRICLDHCHKTGKFRGSLCSPCNTILGHAHDRIEVLKQAILYLQERG